MRTNATYVPGRHTAYRVPLRVHATPHPSAPNLMMVTTPNDPTPRAALRENIRLDAATGPSQTYTGESYDALLLPPEVRATLYPRKGTRNV